MMAKTNKELKGPVHKSEDDMLSGLSQLALLSTELLTHYH